MKQLLVYALLISIMSPLHAMSDPDRKERAAALDSGQDYPLHHPRYAARQLTSIGMASLQEKRSTCAAFHPDGATLAYASDDHAQSPTFFDLARNYGTWPVQPLAGTTTSMTFCADGTLFALSKKLYNQQSSLTLLRDFNREVIPYAWKTVPLSLCTSSTTCMQFNHDKSTLALTSRSGAVRLWDIADGRCTGVLQERAIEPTYTLAYVDNNIVCFNDERNGLVLRDIRSPAATHIVDVHKGMVRTVSANLTRKLLVSGAYDGSVRFADLRKLEKELVKLPYENNSPVTSVAMHPHYADCITGYRDGHVRFHLSSGEYSILVGNEHQARITAVTLSAAKEYWAASVSYDGFIKFYNSKNAIMAFQQKIKSKSEQEKKKDGEQAAAADDKPSCPICRKGYASDDDDVDNIQVALSCKHEFHHGCVKKWLASEIHHGNCPLCDEKHEGKLIVASKKQKTT